MGVRLRLPRSPVRSAPLVGSCPGWLAALLCPAGRCPFGGSWVCGGACLRLGWPPPGFSRLACVFFGGLPFLAGRGSGSGGRFRSARVAGRRRCRRGSFRLRRGQDGAARVAFIILSFIGKRPPARFGSAGMTPGVWGGAPVMVVGISTQKRRNFVP